MSEEQKPLFNTEPPQRPIDPQKLRYIKTIEEIKAWQEKEKIAKELEEMMNGEDPGASQIQCRTR